MYLTRVVQKADTFRRSHVRLFVGVLLLVGVAGLGIGWAAHATHHVKVYTQLKSGAPPVVAAEASVAPTSSQGTLATLTVVVAASSLLVAFGTMVIMYLGLRMQRRSSS